MATKLTINQLVDDVLSELERLNYSYNSLCGFRSFYKRVLDFANERKELYFSEQLGREFFYTHLLPSFKAQGKTVIAVTHDDRFFHVADRLIHLEYGKISE
jgi:ABC-type siderophore export system, fused ATPase and permease components